MRIRKNLLKYMVMIESTSGNENLITPLVVEELSKLKFDISLDESGNIYAVRGKADKYPMLNAHLDMVDVNDDYSGVFSERYLAYLGDTTNEKCREYIMQSLTLEETQECFTCEDCIESYSWMDATSTMCPHYGVSNKVVCDELRVKYDSQYKIDELGEQMGFEMNIPELKKPKKKELTIYETADGLIKSNKARALGGDDKCGIFIALEIARLMKDQPLKILFTTGEECGCVGIRHFILKHLDWLNDVAYSITIDRRYGDNLLWYQCGERSCSNDFAGRLAYAGITNGIEVKLEHGTVADVIYIRDHVQEAVNISAGYYNPHSEDEYISLGDVKKIISWVRTFINNENTIFKNKESVENVNR